MKKKKKFLPMQQDDRVFFHGFYAANKQYIFYLTGRYPVTAIDREDLLQDTVVRLMNNIPTLRQLNTYEAAKYIALTVRSVYLDQEKSKRKAVLLLASDIEMSEAVLTQYQETDADQIAAANAAVHKLKEELPARDWLVLDAKYNLGLTQEEISTLINVSPDSVRMILSRARKKAQQILGCQNTLGGEHYE